MGGETVVLDSSNLDAIVADATGEPLQKPEVKAEPVQPRETKAAPEPAKAAEEDENGLTEEQKKILTKTMQAAVGKKHRQWRETEERLAREAADRRRAEERANDLEKRLQAIEEAQRPKPEPAKKPERASFESDEAYQDALVEFRVKEQLAKEKAAEAKQREEERQQKVLEDAAKRIQHARDIVPDWPTQDELEAMADDDLRIPPAVAGYLQESELIAELTYHFFKNPQELERLNAFTPGRQLVEIGKIESKLSPFVSLSDSKGAKVQPRTVAKTEPNGKKPSTETDASPSRPQRSAPVIRPLTTRGAPQVEKAESEMDTGEARRAWERRNGVSLVRRQRH